jgi:hypothetical protein
MVLMQGIAAKLLKFTICKVNDGAYYCIIFIFMRKIFTVITACFAVFSLQNLSAQGCVAVRGFGGCGVAGGSGLALAPGQWQVGTNYRYFKSFRHFKGDEEQFDRLVKQTQVINHSNTLDLSASMGLTLRTQLNVSLPVSYTDRSSYYEHGGQTTTFPGARKTSTSAGIGDARIGISSWLWNPVSHTKSNLMLGVGLKLPTGNWNVQDSFYNVLVTDPVSGTSSRQTVYRPVDQSIQLALACLWNCKVFGKWPKGCSLMEMPFIF